MNSLDTAPLWCLFFNSIQSIPKFGGALYGLRKNNAQVDTAMAITFSSFFSLGIVLLTSLRSRLDLEELLFGDILSIAPADVWELGFITLAVLIAVKVSYKELLFFTFDPLGAEAIGLPATAMNVGLMAVITLTIVASLKAVGFVLVVALMVSPAAAAYLLTKELHWMMGVGAGLGVFSSLMGMYISYYFDTPSGPAIALTLFACFLLTLLFSPSQGILTRSRGQSTLCRSPQRLALPPKRDVLRSIFSICWRS